MASPFIKDPDAYLDYYINWTLWLAGDSIAVSTWSTSDVAVTLNNEAIVGAITQVWVDGGVAGSLVPLRNHIVTAAGRKEDRTLYIVVWDK